MFVQSPDIPRPRDIKKEFISGSLSENRASNSITNHHYNYQAKQNMTHTKSHTQTRKSVVNYNHQGGRNQGCM